jgi:hypothetical protein
MWIFKLYEVKNAFPQLGSEHLNRYSPESCENFIFAYKARSINVLDYIRDMYIYIYIYI